MNISELKRFYKRYRETIFNESIFIAFVLFSIPLAIFLPIEGRTLFLNLFQFLFSLYLFAIALYIALQATIAYYESNFSGATFCMIICILLICASFLAMLGIFQNKLS